MSIKSRKPISMFLGGAMLLALLPIYGCGAAQGGASGSGISVKQQAVGDSFDRDISIEKTTLVDNPEVEVTADSLSFKNDNIYLDITATNKTDSKIQVSAGTFGFSGNYINNYMVSDGYLSIELAPQETKTSDIYFQTLELSLLGIKTVGEIGIGLDIKYNEFGSDSSSFNLDTICQEIAVIKTSASDSVDMQNDTYQTAINDSAILTTAGASMLAFNGNGGFDQNGIEIKSLCLIKNKDDDVTFFIEIQNNTDSVLMARASDVSINGLMAYEGSWTGNTIAPSKTAVMDITLNDVIEDDQLENFDLNNIQTVGIEFSVTDSDLNTVVTPVELEFSF